MHILDEQQALPEHPLSQLEVDQASCVFVRSVVGVSVFVNQ